jgi:hypothetical protein
LAQGNRIGLRYPGDRRRDLVQRFSRRILTTTRAGSIGAVETELFTGFTFPALGRWRNS